MHVPGHSRRLSSLLRTVLSGETAENDWRADGWKPLYHLWRWHLSALGAKMRLRPEQVEDLLQDVFLALQGRWEEYRGLGAEALLALSRKLMHDRAVDLIRVRDRHRALPLEALPSEPISRDSSEGPYPTDREEWIEYLRARMDELKRHKKDYFELVYAHHVEGQSSADLAAKAGCSVHAMECRLARAMQALRRFVEEHPPGGGPPL